MSCVEFTKNSLFFMNLAEINGLTEDELDTP